MGHVSSTIRLERQFGYLVGAVFLAVGLLTGWRGHWPFAVSAAAALVGALLMVLGWLAPAMLAGTRRRWMAMAEVLSVISTRIILAFVFFGIITPLGMAMRLFGWDPLAGKLGPRHSHWVDYPATQRDTRHFERMF